MGPKVGELECALAGACGTADAVVVSSGTAALHLAMLALEIGPGDEVIVPAYTFPATANAVELCGGRAVLVDVDPDTFNLDIGQVAAAVTPRTKAVLAVHLFGRPVEWEELQTAVPQEVALVEDAAGALGARYRGTPCGSLGVMGCLSFHPRKIVTTGEGGAVTTDEAELADAIRRLRHHGIVPRGDFDIPAPGLNYRLPDLLCAIGIPQVERLEELLAARERVAGWYTERLEHLVLTPSAAEGDRHGWQAYVVQLDRRDEALQALRARGDRGADRHLRAPPPRRLSRPWPVPRRRPGVRAGARAPVRDDDDRGRVRSRRRSADAVRLVAGRGEAEASPVASGRLDKPACE